jgi:flagellar P-ring protein precursor FlgI
MTPRLLETLLISLLVCAFAGEATSAERIKDLMSVQGLRNNQLVGYGVVVGLDNTGDQTTQTPFTIQTINSMLSSLGVQLPSGTNPQLKNVAAVMVTASLPAYAKPGQQIDITVSSMGNAKSLRGGTLLMTQLKGTDGNTYAIAQGSLLVPGAGASSGGTSTTVNHLSAGRVPGGATVERAVPTPLGQGDFVNLEAQSTDFTTVARVVQTINNAFGEGVAAAVDGRQVRVAAPADPTQRVEFMARLEGLQVASGEAPPKVVMNARTGSVVMNQLVTLTPCAVSHGNLTVSVQTQPLVSQPGALSGGRTAVAEQATVEIKGDQGKIISMPAAPSLNDVVRALNAVGATPQDLLGILQAMKSAGALRAELEII